MTKGMRFGLVTLCVAALAGLLVLVLQHTDSPTGASLYSVAALLFVIAAPVGLVVVAVSVARWPR